MLFTIAMPRWEGDGGNRVQAWRLAHDPQAQRVGPHVTLLFGTETDEATYVDHVKAVAASTRPFGFELTHAMPHATAPAMAHVYLVPERGTAAFARLNRRLYGGPMAPWHVLEQPFIPHVTLGVFLLPMMALALADQWNAKEGPVHGEVASLTIGRLGPQGFGVLDEIALGGSA